MRGTSQREDGAFWVVQVLKTHSRKDKKKETLFPTIFEKTIGKIVVKSKEILIGYLSPKMGRPK
jgi:hypothetical protein